MGQDYLTGNDRMVVRYICLFEPHPMFKFYFKTYPELLRIDFQPGAVDLLENDLRLFQADFRGFNLCPVTELEILTDPSNFLFCYIFRQFHNTSTLL